MNFIVTKITLFIIFPGKSNVEEGKCLGSIYPGGMSEGRGRDQCPGEGTNVGAIPPHLLDVHRPTFIWQHDVESGIPVIPVYRPTRGVIEQSSIHLGQAYRKSMYRVTWADSASATKHPYHQQTVTYHL